MKDSFVPGKLARVKVPITLGFTFAPWGIAKIVEYDMGGFYILQGSEGGQILAHEDDIELVEDK